MRVIAGNFKNKRLDFISNESTRPTADMVKEGLFSKIQFNIPNSTFLDLFSGSGSIGIEALSRGAKKVIFIEKDRQNSEIMLKNLNNVYNGHFKNGEEIDGQISYIITRDYVNAIKSLSEPFDFVYMDPPYKSDFYKVAIRLLKEQKLLTSESMVICEHEAKVPLSFDDFELITTKRYGIKMLSYFKLI